MAKSEELKDPHLPFRKGGFPTNEQTPKETSSRAATYGLGSTAADERALVYLSLADTDTDAYPLAESPVEAADALVE